LRCQSIARVAENIQLIKKQSRWHGVADNKKKKSTNHSSTPAKKPSMMAEAKKKAEAMESAKAKDKKAGRKKGSPIAKYFKDMRSELKKVVWPSRKKVVNNTGVVMVVMIIYGLMIWGIDSGLAAIFNLALK
jgi:preprotein translocase subunit SecE